MNLFQCQFCSDEIVLTPFVDKRNGPHPRDSTKDQNPGIKNPAFGKRPYQNPQPRLDTGHKHLCPVSHSLIDCSIIHWTVDNWPKG